MAGYRLEKPEDSLCPQECYDLMLECWEADQAERPIFLEIVQRLADMFLSLKPQDVMLETKLKELKERPAQQEVNHYVDMDGAEDEVCLVFFLFFFGLCLFTLDNFIDGKFNIDANRLYLLVARARLE